MTLSRQAQSEDLYRVKKDDNIEKQGFDVTTWGVALQMESDSRAGDWVYGAEYYRDGVDSYARKYKPDGSLSKVEIQGPVADDASYDTAGLYVEDTLRCFGGKLDVVPGARYTYAKADADKVKDPVTGNAISLDDDWNAVVGSLRLLLPLTPDRRHVLFGGVSQGFRAPNLSDLTRLDMARSKEIETPSPDLDPENYVAYEIGLKSRVGAPGFSMELLLHGDRQHDRPNPDRPEDRRQHRGHKEELRRWICSGRRSIRDLSSSRRNGRPG